MTEFLVQHVDLYCERTSIGFWNEPWNALSNLSMTLSAVFGFYLYLKSSRRSPWLFSLSLVALIVSLGSFTFHTLATQWAMLADVIPIFAFILLYLAFVLQKGFSLPLSKTTFWLLAYLCIGVALQILLPKTFMNGSGPYLLALTTLILTERLLRKSSPHLAKHLCWASILFTFSLFFRSIDNAVCISFPPGTHFLWHTLNGVLIAVLLSSVRSQNKNIGV